MEQPIEGKFSARSVMESAGRHGNVVRAVRGQTRALARSARDLQTEGEVINVIASVLPCSQAGKALHSRRRRGGPGVGYLGVEWSVQSRLWSAQAVDAANVLEA